jgi:cation:H+ antiporter
MVSILDPGSWALLQSIVPFRICALVIAIAGTRITRVVDQLADRTGLGEATAGKIEGRAQAACCRWRCR